MTTLASRQTLVSKIETRIVHIFIVTVCQLYILCKTLMPILLELATENNLGGIIQKAHISLDEEITIAK